MIHGILLHFCAHFGITYFLLDWVGNWLEVLFIGFSYKLVEWLFWGCTIESFCLSMLYNLFGVLAWRLAKK